MCVILPVGVALSLLVGAAVLYRSDRVLPGVRTAGIDVGGMPAGEVARVLDDTWANDMLTLQDGERRWDVAPHDLGLRLDAAATADAAVDWGRRSGGISGMWEALVGTVDVAPVLAVDRDHVTRYLQEIGPAVEQPPVNAGVALVDGQAVPTAAHEGRALDIAATAARLASDPTGVLADGVLELVMIPVPPAITDAAPLVAEANALLSQPFEVAAYDPIRDERHTWQAPPAEWVSWLVAEADPDSPHGLALTLDPVGPRAFLQAKAAFTDERTIRLDDAIQAMRDALAQGDPRAAIRVWHGPTRYTVRAGQTLAAIAEEVGVPYPYIAAENPGINIDALSAGQVLTIPSRDILVPLEPVPHKRIVVDRGRQHLWAYENGQVVFDWVISTGLPSSPTAPGVFQVQSHDPNAYADQWNLYMPHFMGFYHPGPNMDLMNGFHGFPTRGGGYLLWSDDLGRPVTYGCVLLSLENAERMYTWAEDGVIVEVRA